MTAILVMACVIFPASVSLSQNSGSSSTANGGIIEYKYGWAIRRVEDRFDGMIISFGKHAANGESFLAVSIEDKCEKCWKWDRYSISYKFKNKFLCGYTDPSAESVKELVKPTKLAVVKWMVDNGPVHVQDYKIMEDGSWLYFQWVLKSTIPSNLYRSYKTLTEAYKFFIPGTDEIRVIPPDDMLRILASGRTVYLRAWDKCSQQDIEFDLTGLREVLREIDGDILRLK